jgi:hypothetical protein
LIRKLIDQASTNITLLWVPSHVGIPGNESATEALNEETHHTETYPPQDLIAWIKEKHEQEQQEKWENSTTTMKERKPHHIMNPNTKTMTRREHVVISRLPIGYTRASHCAVMDKEPSPECLFCAVNLTTDHILWHCKETTINGHNKGNLEGRKTRDGKADQVRERNRIFRRNIKGK